MLALFTVTHSPCGKVIYEVEASDWAAFGYPHPVTNAPVHAPRGVWIREDDPANRYGMDYFMADLGNDVALRILND